MTRLFQSAMSIQSFLQKQNWSFCFIGGIALQRWGEPRLTIDIDISLFTDFDDANYIHEILQHFESRISDPKAFAHENRILLIMNEGIGVDIVLSGIPFEREMIERSSLFQFTEAITLITCSAEDLIVMKAFADRDKDWGDVSGIIMRQAGCLDWAYILEELKPLADVKENPDILDHLENLKNKYEM